MKIQGKPEVFREIEIDRLEREHGVKIQRLAELLYFNEAGIRVRTLLWPDRDRDLTRVVLVANR